MNLIFLILSFDLHMYTHEHFLFPQFKSILKNESGIESWIIVKVSENLSRIS